MTDGLAKLSYTHALHIISATLVSVTILNLVSLSPGIQQLGTRKKKKKQ
jgi:hypothetical protein